MYEPFNNQNQLLSSARHAAINERHNHLLRTWLYFYYKKKKGKYTIFISYIKINYPITFNHVLYLDIMTVPIKVVELTTIVMKVVYTRKLLYYITYIFLLLRLYLRQIRLLLFLLFFPITFTRFVSGLPNILRLLSTLHPFTFTKPNIILL